MTERGVLGTVVEVRRGVFEVPVILEEMVSSILHDIPHGRSENRIFLAHDHITSVTERFIQANVAVTTIAGEIAALSQPQSARPSHSYFGEFRVPGELKGADWRRYSFTTRRLLAARPYKKDDADVLFLREGQPAVALSGNNHRGYYIAEGGELRRCPDPQSLLEQCHWQSLPATVYYEDKGLSPFLILHPTPAWLPPKHYTLLYKQLIGTPRKGTNFLLLHKDDLPLAREVLASLTIALNEGRPPEQTNLRTLEIVEHASEATRMAYSAYLKSEAGLVQLEQIGASRSWEEISDERFLALLRDLSNRAYEFEPLAEELLTYLIDRLPRSIDWQQVHTEENGALVEGVVLDVERTSLQQNSAQKYYKVVIKEFGLVLGVLTKRLRTNKRTVRRAEYFVANRWRATPYAGRIKFTGWSDSFHSDWISGKGAAKAGYMYIYGIPSFEARLAREIYLSAFFLDRDSKYWRGYNELSRYFAGHGRLIEKMVADFDEPAVLMEDVFGNPFYLKLGRETYLAHEDFLQFTATQTWKRFTAHSGLRSLLDSESGIPAFELQHGSVPKDVGHLQVVCATILALLRYHGEMAAGKLTELLYASHVRTNLIDEALAQLVSEKRLVLEQDTWYYNYPYCSVEDRAILNNPASQAQLSQGARQYYRALRPFLPMIHPLGYGRSLLSREGGDSVRQNLVEQLHRSDRFASIVNNRNITFLEKKVLEEIKRYGVSVLRAHPWNVNQASCIVEYVREQLSNYQIEVRRKDVPAQYKGRDTIETWLRVFCPDIIEHHRWAKMLSKSGFASRVTVKR